MPRVTQLYYYHARNAKLTEFAGFLMPLYYKGIVEEHLAVRERVGAFDVSHMGRIIVEGDEATSFLEELLPSNVNKTRPGRAFYTLLLDERGGIKDDLIVLRLEEDRYLLVVNAANREKDLAWISGQPRAKNVIIKTISDEMGMIALQGPRAQEILQGFVGVDPAQVKRFSHTWTDVKGIRTLVSRTGYTGEDGFELIIPDSPIQEPDNAMKVWEAVLSAGAVSCGLGARDTLRLEAGICLYGSDINEEVNPFEASLAWVLDLNKPSFIGREALLSQKDSYTKLRVGLIMAGAGIPRSGFPIRYSGREIGVVTSGTYSPLLKKGIAMGYVSPAQSSEGTRLDILIRGEEREAHVKGFPLYDATKYGWKRSMK